MKMSTSITAAISLSALVAFYGCQNSTRDSEMQNVKGSGEHKPETLFVKAKITRYYTPEGAYQEDSTEVTDSNEVQRLAAFFPELGKKDTKESEYGSGGWEKMADIEFFGEHTEPLRVTVDPAFDTYACTNGKGDYPVKTPNEFQKYFQKLFTEGQQK